MSVTSALYLLYTDPCFPVINSQGSLTLTLLKHTSSMRTTQRVFLLRVACITYVNIPFLNLRADL